MSAKTASWLAALLAALVAAAAVSDWSWLKEPLERRVTAQTGRELVLGDLRVRLGFPTRVRVQGLRFDNPPWAAAQRMLAIEKAEFTVRVLPLLGGRLVLPEIRLTRPEVNLERDAQGGNNWTLTRDPAAADGQGRGVPVIGRLTVDRGRLRFVDATRETDLRIAAQTFDEPEPGLRVEARGRFRGRDLAADATGEPVLMLADTDEPYSLKGEFRIGPTAGTVDGSVTGLAAFAAADLRLVVKGDSLAELYPLLPVSLPATPPYSIRGRLLRDGTAWRLHGFTGQVGDSDLSGDADFLRRDGRLHLQASLESQLLDLNDLGGVIGAPPGTGAGETASPQQERAAQQAAASPTLLPDKEFRFNRLRAMDASVRFTGRHIRGGKTPLDDVELTLALHDGVLRMRPLDFGVAGGNVVSTVTLDARRQSADIDAEFEFRRIRLSELFPGNDMIGRSAGLIGGRAELAGQGRSFADWLATADGTVGLAMTGGRVSNLMLEAVGLDAAEIVRFLFAGDKTVPLRCAVAEFAMNEGVLEARSVVVDTEDTKISAEGRINLRDETLDLTLHPLPKDYSPLSLRSPLHLEGSFRDPDIGLDDDLLLKGGVAAVLAAVAAPLAALMPLIETGPGVDSDCGQLVEAAQQYAGEKAPPAP